MHSAGSTASVQCSLKNILRTCSNEEKTRSRVANQVAVIIKSSNKMYDGFAEGMKNANNKNLKYHSSRYSTKTSSTKIEQYITTKIKSEDGQSTSVTSLPAKRLRSR